MPFDYKSVAKSRKARQQILRLFDWVPDCVMVPVQYRIKTGRWPNLKNPQRYTEKLQWLKLNYRDSLMCQCADKVAVRSYVASCGLENILVPLLGVYNSPQEINFDMLPDQFVLKDSLGGGGNEVLICADKDSFDWNNASVRMQEWVVPGRHQKHPGREWVYDTPGSSKILAEVYVAPDFANDGLVEFKFLCFYGKPSYLYVLGNRMLGHSAKLGIFKADDMSRVEAWSSAESRLTDEPLRPGCYGEMMDAAARLSEPFPEARIDFYYAGEQSGFRFSEITFFDASGYFLFEPDSFDYELGNSFILP